MPDFTDKLRPSQPDGPTTLAHERGQSKISVDELGRHLLSSDGFLERQARVLSIVQREPILSKEKQQNLSRPERFKLGLARAKLLRRLAGKHQWSHDDYKMAEYLVDDVSPYLLHMEMFVTTIREQASEAQRAYWMPLIESWKIVGAYAQTELGHGSNVRGLELEARWDSCTKEFVLHSPTLTASKWWNGSLGRIANHAIVVAQLLLPRPGSPDQYVSHGPHPFIVQVRDMKTHQPLDGVVVGDIGSKYGYITMDNAYMLFDHFRYATGYSMRSVMITDKAQDSTLSHAIPIFQRQYRHRCLHKARAACPSLRIPDIRPCKHRPSCQAGTRTCGHCCSEIHRPSKAIPGPRWRQEQPRDVSLGLSHRADPDPASTGCHICAPLHRTSYAHSL